MHALAETILDEFARQFNLQPARGDVDFYPVFSGRYAVVTTDNTNLIVNLEQVS